MPYLARQWARGRPCVCAYVCTMGNHPSSVELQGLDELHSHLNVYGCARAVFKCPHEPLECYNDTGQRIQTLGGDSTPDAPSAGAANASLLQ